jgi:hypothetical protein
MNTLNPQALHGRESGKEIFIEDVSDPDGRMYRIEYKCAPDGTNATAYVRYNPWGYNAYSYQQSHLDSADGLICVGKLVNRSNCPYGLEYTVRRARTWCTGYSFLREHGYSRTCQVMPEWAA